MATKIERILAPSRGLNTFDGPSAIPRDMAPELVNFLPGAAGKLRSRGSVRAFERTSNVVEDWASSVGISSLGSYVSNSNMCALFGEKLIVSNTNRTGLLTCTSLNTGAGTYVDLGPARHFYSYRGSAEFDGLFYALNQSASPTIINSIDQSGTVVAFTANAPRNGTFIFSYLETLWVFGGRDTPAGSTTDKYSRLYYVNPGTTPADTVAAWQTDGTTNKIQVGDESLNDVGVAAIPFQKSLLLFKSNSLHQMIGTEPANFEVRKIADIGCLNAHVPLATDDAVYWFSPETGFMVYKEGQVRRTLTQLATQFDISTSEIRLSRLGGAYILVYVTSPEGGAQSYVFHTDSETASEITVSFPTANSSTESSPLTQSISEQPVVFALQGAFGGTNQFLLGVGWDSPLHLATAPLTFPVPDYLDRHGDRGPGLNGSPPYNHPFTRLVYNWTSRTIRVTSPMNKARLTKLCIDYKCRSGQFSANDYSIGDSSDHVDSPGPSDSTAPEVLYVKIIGEDGTTLLAETELPAQGWYTTSLDRRRHMIDLGGVEASEFKVQIYSKEGANASGSPDYTGARLEIPRSDTLEIHDVWVEYEEAQRRVAV